MTNRRLRAVWVSTLLAAMHVLSGCAHEQPKAPTPQMSAGEGAILGKLGNSDGDPFDLSQTGDGGAGALKIQLISPDKAVVATTSPWEGKPQFAFDHVKPGTYELSVYRFVPGMRTIAGSEPVTVDEGQATPVTIRLQVTNIDEDAASR